MRFERLDLIRYGKFAGRTIDFPRAKRDFHLIVGPNEAGKSTVRAAILDLLFGIPVRSAHGFLHPLNELRLGGVVADATGTLAFHRAKAARQTLRTPADAVLADTALSAYLGGADRNFFDQMFGLDHTRLVEGGNSILSAENDVGQVLFQSAAGVASLGKVRDALIAEADKLWSARRSGDRAYYIASSQLDEATAALKEATVRTRIWAEANERVESSRDALEAERTRHQQLLGERNRLERIRRLAPFLRALREHEAQRAEWGAVPEMPVDAAATLARAERDLATATRLLEVREAEVAGANAELARIVVDAPVLEQAADIVALDALRQQYSPYGRDIERLEGEVAALWRAVGEACAQLGWPVESEAALAARLPGVLVRRELERLAREQGAIGQALRAAEQAERTKLSEIGSLSRQLGELQAGEVRPALRAALSGARDLGDPEAALQQQRARLVRADDDLEAALRALEPWRKPAAALAAMQPPGALVLARMAQERQTLAAGHHAARQACAGKRSDAAAIELEIAQFRELHHPVTQATVTAARQQRDAIWVEIRSRAADPAAAAPRFEAALTEADRVADTRLEHVGDATALQGLQHRLARDR